MNAAPSATTTSPRSGRKVLLYMLGVLLVTVVPSILLPTLLCRPPAPVLEDYGELPAFALRDENDHEFTQEALRGHVTIVNFILYDHLSRYR